MIPIKIKIAYTHWKQKNQMLKIPPFNFLHFSDSLVSFSSKSESYKFSPSQPIFGIWAWAVGTGGQLMGLIMWSNVPPIIPKFYTKKLFDILGHWHFKNVLFWHRPGHSLIQFVSMFAKRKLRTQCYWWFSEKCALLCLLFVVFINRSIIALEKQQ